MPDDFLRILFTSLGGVFMLEKIDLNKKMTKKEFKEKAEPL